MDILALWLAFMCALTISPAFAFVAARHVSVIHRLRDCPSPRILGSGVDARRLPFLPGKLTMRASNKPGDMGEAVVTRREGLKHTAVFFLGAPAFLSARAARAEPSALVAPAPPQAGGAAVMDVESVFCDQAVSRLTNSVTGQEVYIVGTAHVSRLSAELVRDTIRLTQPDNVMVELDSKRVKVQTRRSPTPDEAQPSAATAAPPPPERDPSPDKPPSSLMDLIKTEWVKPLSFGEKLANVEAGVIGLAISSLYQKLDRMGFQSGQEFVTAIREAEASGAALILGDRPVDVTLKRLQQSIEKTGFSEVMAFANAQAESREEKLLSSQLSPKAEEAGEVDATELAATVEMLKERKTVRKIMASLRSALPEVYAALIGERDEYLARSLLSASARKQNSVSVAVVGMAHMDGIEKFLGENGYTLAPPTVACAPQTLNRFTE